MVIARDGFFYPTLTRIMDSFSCSPLHTSFYVGKYEKDFEKILNSLRCDMVMSFFHYNDIKDRCAVNL